MKKMQNTQIKYPVPKVPGADELRCVYHTTVFTLADWKKE